MSELRQIMFDTETTGIEASEHRVIEIGAIELRNRRVTAEQRWYLNPDRDSDPGALEVHGLTTAFLADKPRFRQVADEVIEFLRGAELIIHNAAFDVSFLNKELERVGKKPFASYVGGVIDTLVMAKEMFPGKRNSLDALCDRLEVDNSGRTLHGALLDAELLADVYINMTRGQEALLIDAGENTANASKNVLVQTDLSHFELPVLLANAQETAAHEELLGQLDKSSGGKTVWRQTQTAAF